MPIFRSTLLDKRFPRGEQVIDYGPVPDHPNEVFEVWSRGLCRKLVSDLGDNRVQFAYAYYDEDEQGRRKYRVTTALEDQSLEEFLKIAPSHKETNQVPSYVVILHEPDLILENGVPRSPLWYTARRPSDVDRGDYQERGPALGRGGETFLDRRWTAFPENPLSPTLLRTTDVRRSRANLVKMLPELADVYILRDPRDLDKVKFTEPDLSPAGVVLLAKNLPEFRAAVQRAAEMRRLTHKQVALITSGDLQKEIAELRETLLEHGAVMVWTPDREISEQAGERLIAQISETLKQDTKPRDINDLLVRSIADLLRANPNDPDLKDLWQSGAWV